MQEIRCANPDCRTTFGPAVGTWVTVSVGQAMYVLDGVFAITCDACRSTLGSIPTAGPASPAQDVRCPSCDRKSGELLPHYAVLSSGGRTVWAQRILRVACRCGCDFEPARYAAMPVIRLRPRPGSFVSAERLQTNAAGAGAGRG